MHAMWEVWIIGIIYIVNIKAQYGTYHYSLLDKPTQQSSNWTQGIGGDVDIGYSGRAVDGNDDNVYEHRSCSHTASDLEPWWAVDMEEVVTVFSITITNRKIDCCQDRLDKFSIYGSNQTFNPFDDQSKQSCYTFDEVFGNGATRTFNCSQPVTARYLSVALPLKGIVTLCEVQIQAVCPNGTYGENCTGTCSSHCMNPPCDKFTANGTCPEGPNGKCMAGYKGDNCATPCSLGTYGDGCKPCSPHCKNSCAQMSSIGMCNEGCVAGYKGDTCATECAPGYFGEKCLESCHCKEGICNHITGLGCEECEDGYAGDPCSEEGKTTSSTTEKTTRNSTPGGTTMGDNTGNPTVGAQQNTDPPSSNTPAIAGGVAGVAVVVVVLVIVLILIMRYRKTKVHSKGLTNEYENDALTVDKMERIVKQVSSKPDARIYPPSSSEIEMTEEARATGEVPESTYANVTGQESKTRLQLEEVPKFMENVKKQEPPLVDEYEEIPKVTSSWEEANVPELKSKNRYINILPYDHNRVKLQSIDNEAQSTYINASYIEDYDGQTSYIAALGPTDKTLEDWWRMIWETGISYVVMVTNLVEDSKTKCIQYWPFGKTAQYGGISVSLEKEEWRAHCVKRTMKASTNKNSRVITHYHYTVWPDKQAPTNLSSVLQLREIVKSIRLQRKIPILIHCSAGIGRTGTLIALDILLNQTDKEGAIDVYKCVAKLREQRTQMVQTVDQYIFLYNAFDEIAQLGRTAISVKNVDSNVKSPKFEAQTAKQFDYLDKIKQKIKTEDLMCGMVDNTEKNRDQNIVAGDEHRVILMSNPDVYVNAVYVDDYRRPLAFCATQLPLKDTVGHFWKMMFELKSPTIVCLEVDYSDTWRWIPDKNEPIICENIYIGLKEIKEETCLTIYHIDLSTNMEAIYANAQPQHKSGEFYQLQLFKLKSWTSAPLPERDLTPIRSVLKQVQTLVNKTGRSASTVMCKNGATETGLYIALSILVDNMKSEQEVDVFQVVKLIRRSRPEFIISQEQYNWLYQAMTDISHHK